MLSGVCLFGISTRVVTICYHLIHSWATFGTLLGGYESCDEETTLRRYYLKRILKTLLTGNVTVHFNGES